MTIPDKAFRIFSERIGPHGRELETLARDAVENAGSPEDLKQSVQQVIKTSGLKGEQVNRLCEMANVEMFRRLYVEGDRDVDFPPVQVEDLMSTKAAGLCVRNVPKRVDIRKHANYRPYERTNEFQKEATLSTSLNVEDGRTNLANDVYHVRQFISEAANELDELKSHQHVLATEADRQLFKLSCTATSYLRKGASLYEVMSLAEPCGVTQDACLHIIKTANVEEIDWQQGSVSDIEGKVARDDLDLREDFSEYIHRCFLRDNASEKVSELQGLIDELNIVADSVEKIAAAGGIIRGAARGTWRQFKNVMFGVKDKVGPQNLSLRSRPRKGFSGDYKFVQTSDPKRVDEIRKTYGDKYIHKIGPDRKGKELWEVAKPQYGGLYGIAREHPIATTFAAVAAPAAAMKLSTDAKARKQQMSQPLGSYAPTSYGSY